MTLNFFLVIRNNKSTAVAISAVCALVVGCNNSTYQNIESMRYENGDYTSVMSLEIPLEMSFEKNLSHNFPAPDVNPELKFTSIRSVFQSPSQITQGANTEEILLKLRSISSLTKDFHQELLDTTRQASLLDFPHLMLLVDAVYFPALTYDLMNQILVDPQACRNLTPDQCKKMLAQVKANSVSALQFGSYANQILLAGKSKLTALNATQVFDFLKRTFPESAIVDQIFSETLSPLESLSAEEKLNFARLAVAKSAQVAAKNLALNWFTSNSNKTPEELIRISNLFTMSEIRDVVLTEGLKSIAALNVDQAKKIASMVRDPSQLQILKSLFPKILGLTGKDLANLVEPILTGPGRDEALLAGIPHVVTSDVAGNIAVLKLAYNTKLEITIALLAKTPNLSAMNLAAVAKESLYESTRDKILAKGNDYVTVANADGAIAMISLATKVKYNLTLGILPKILNLSARDFGVILKSISDGTIRDSLITNGLSLIKVFDGAGAALIVEQSVNSKYATAVLLFNLIPSVTGMDLDKMLAVCSYGVTRDQILSKTVPLLPLITKNEVKLLYSRAYASKDTIAVLLISKVDNLDGQTIGEMALLSKKGATRDLIITEGLKRLTIVDAIGLIAMIKAADKLVEKLALEVSSMVKNLVVDDALAIVDAINNSNLKNRFLIHAIDLVINLDEPGITMLALAATTQSAKEEIVKKGIDKLGDSQ